MKTEPIKVIFRTWTRKPYAGNVDAIFPELPEDVNGYRMTVYSHCGQHSGGDRHYFYGQTRPATPEESAPLLRELTRIGYNQLDFVRRVTAAMDRKRMETAREHDRKITKRNTEILLDLRKQ